MGWVIVKVEDPPITLFVLGLPKPVNAVTLSPLALTAPSLAAALKYRVVAFPIPVATVTSPVDPLAIATEGCVTVNVLPVPRTVSVVGLSYPVTAVTLSPLALTAPPDADALIFVVETLFVYATLPVAVELSSLNVTVGSVTLVIPVATLITPVPAVAPVARATVG